MTEHDSKTIGRTHLGFAAPQEYREAAERLRAHQERLYNKACEEFDKIEARRAREERRRASRSTD